MKNRFYPVSPDSKRRAELHFNSAKVTGNFKEEGGRGSLGLSGIRGENVQRVVSVNVIGHLGLQAGRYQVKFYLSTVTGRLRLSFLMISCQSNGSQTLERDASVT